MRHLVLVLGDQLDRRSAAFDGFDPAQDAAWMAEAPHESTPLRSSLPRIALFLACMRHFREALRAEGLRVEYHPRGSVRTSQGCDRRPWC
jgi:deoxyribodipyrimidine photolyase-related protein